MDGMPPSHDVAVIGLPTMESDRQRAGYAGGCFAVPSMLDALAATPT